MLTSRSAGSVTLSQNRSQTFRSTFESIALETSIKSQCWMRQWLGIFFDSESKLNALSMWKGLSDFTFRKLRNWTCLVLWGTQTWVRDDKRCVRKRKLLKFHFLSWLYWLKLKLRCSNGCQDWIPGPVGRTWWKFWALYPVRQYM